MQELRKTYLLCFIKVDSAHLGDPAGRRRIYFILIRRPLIMLSNQKPKPFCFKSAQGCGCKIHQCAHCVGKALPVSLYEVEDGLCSGHWTATFFKWYKQAFLCLVSWVEFFVPPKVTASSSSWLQLPEGSADRIGVKGCSYFSQSEENPLWPYNQVLQLQWVHFMQLCSSSTWNIKAYPKKTGLVEKALGKNESPQGKTLDYEKCSVSYFPNFHLFVRLTLQSWKNANMLVTFSLRSESVMWPGRMNM